MALNPFSGYTPDVCAENAHKTPLQVDHDENFASTCRHTSLVSCATWIIRTTSAVSHVVVAVVISVTLHLVAIQGA